MADEFKSLRRVGVFGMGLLGGSIALGLKERFIADEVVGYDLDGTALETALAMGAVDRVRTTLGPWIGALDLGILAVPVGALEALALAVAPWAAPQSRWLDVGSVKGSLVPALESLLPHFVGTHPMAGSETPGMDSAYAGLLQNAVWVITPTAATDSAAKTAAVSIIEALGAYAFEVDPDDHDQLVARVSHVPYLVAAALNLMLADDPRRESLLFLAAGGFRDITRVASGSPRMSRDMVCENRAAVRGALADLSEVLRSLSSQLDAPEALLHRAELAKRTRDSLPVVKRTLLPRIYDVVVAIPDRPMELARLATVLGEGGVNIRDIEVLKIRGTGGEAIRVGVGDQGALDLARAVLKGAGYRVR